MTSRDLRQTATVAVPEVSRFVASDHFRERVKSDPADPLRVVCDLNPFFREHLLGKIEENVPAATLVAHLHSKNVRSDFDIVEQLGERAETLLAHVYELLCRQPHGGGSLVGTLGVLSEKPESAFYVKGTDGNLCVVTISFGYHVIDGSGPDAWEHPEDQYWAWNVVAGPIEREFATNKRLVFSR